MGSHSNKGSEKETVRSHLNHKREVKMRKLNVGQDYKPSKPPPSDVLRLEKLYLLKVLPPAQTVPPIRDQVFECVKLGGGRGHFSF